MSINNRTSINDNRQLHDDSKKQYSHQTTNDATKSKKSNQQHHDTAPSHDDDECDTIGELIGKYGKYQFYMTFLLSLFQIPNTFHISSPIYQVST